MAFVDDIKNEEYFNRTNQTILDMSILKETSPDM
jgi:hypothetical protein